MAVGGRDSGGAAATLPGAASPQDLQTRERAMAQILKRVVRWVLEWLLKKI